MTELGRIKPGMAALGIAGGMDIDSKSCHGCNAASSNAPSCFIYQSQEHGCVCNEGDIS